MINISVIKKEINEYMLTIAKDRILTIFSNKSGIALKKTILDIVNMDINFFKIDDIELFFKTGKKKDNDRDNCIRENILSKLNILPEEYINDKSYGSNWNLLKTKWLYVLHELYKEPYDKIIVNKMAGRKYNYDFNVVYLLENKVNHSSSMITNVNHSSSMITTVNHSSSMITTVNHSSSMITTVKNVKKVEFKYNGKSIDKLPQFLQLTENYGFIEKSYAEFYYNNYLQKHIDLITGLDILDKDTYLKLVKGTNYNSNPFFIALKTAEEDQTIKKQINLLVNSSIKEYLETYATSINILNVYNTLNKSQSDKVFILWNNKEFYLDKLDISSNLVYKNIKNRNTIVLEDLDNNHEYHLLLRWKNHKGVLNPAWQISLRKIKK
jgi:hypothetical protein